MKRNLFTFLALCAVLSFTGCKEEPSQIPTVPTRLSLEDGTVVEKLNVNLSASGSTVEDNGFNVSYVYYIGKSADVLEETPANVTLEPYTQYFWCAQARTEAGESEKTEIRTFYCVPKARIELSREFGEDENATTIKWKLYKRGKDLYDNYFYGSEYELDLLQYWIEDPYLEMENSNLYKGHFYEKEVLSIPESKRKQMNITVGISSNEIGDEIKPLELSGDADSVVVRAKDVNNKTIYNIYDTADGQKKLLCVAAYKYKFNVNIEIPVGDKVVNLTQSIESILVDSNSYAIDRELNIYRTTLIGDDRWAIDNLRLSHCYHSDVQIYNVDNTGVRYAYNLYYDGKYVKYLNKYFINGYHVSTKSDWERLEKHFGIEYGRDTISTYEFYLKFKEEDESTYSLSKYFATNVPWEVFSDEDNPNVSHLNSFNVNCYGFDESFSDDAVIFYVKGDVKRVISRKYKSLALAYFTTDRAAIRLVKDKE